MYTRILTGLLILVISTTKEECQKPSEDVGLCLHTATARDFSDLDGCGIMLVLENGKKLLAVNLEAYRPALKEGDVVRITYAKSAETMSICMSEDTMVQLTCLSRLVDAKWVSECPTMIDPFDAEWSNRVLQELDPQRITEMRVDGQWVYRFSAKNEHRVYRCTGELLCSFPPQNAEACKDILNRATDEKIIYVVNE